MLSLIAGCANNGASLLRLQTEAAERKGRVAAGFEPPPLAKVCYREIQHAVPVRGEELSTLLAREGAKINEGNRDNRDCLALEKGWRQDFVPAAAGGGQ